MAYQRRLLPAAEAITIRYFSGLDNALQHFHLGSGTLLNVGHGLSSFGLSRRIILVDPNQDLEQLLGRRAVELGCPVHQADIHALVIDAGTGRRVRAKLDGDELLLLKAVLLHSG